MANPDIVRAVRGYLFNAQDNLNRAKAAFRGYSADDLAKKYGQSDRTCGELLAGYQADVDRWQRALKDAEGLS